jgi:hypothetical protein
VSAPKEELDLVDSILNPLKQPDRRFMTLAGIALPVLLDRAGGSVTFTAADLEAVHERYGGKVAVQLQRTADGRFTAWLIPSTKKSKGAQA